MSRNQMASAKRVSRQDRIARAQLKRRIAAIRAAAEDEAKDEEAPADEAPETEEKDEVDEKEARALKRKARRLRRACLKKAQEMLDEEPAMEDADDAEIAEIAEEVAEEAAEDIIEDVDPDAPFEEIVDEVEDAVEEAIEDVVAKRARKAKRAARRSKRAGEVSDDLVDVDGDSAHIEQLTDGDGISADTEVSDEKSDEVAQEPPASVNEAEDKVAAAYELIEAQIAQNVIQAGAEKAKVASKYIKRYSAREMRFATQQLRAVGSAGKTASASVRVQSRGAMPQMKSAAIGGDIADELAFA